MAKLFNVAYYIVTVINNYLLDEIYPKKEEEEEDDDSKKDLYEPFLSKHGLGKLNESVVYVIYLLSVLKSFHENFKHVSIFINSCKIVDDERISIKNNFLLRRLDITTISPKTI